MEWFLKHFNFDERSILFSWIKKSKKSWYWYTQLKYMGLEPDNDPREGANSGETMQKYYER